MSILKGLYQDHASSVLKKKYGYQSPMQIPRIEKIVLNMRVRNAAQDKKVVANAEKVLGLIAGQAPVRCLARKSNAGFNIRKGFPLGCFVTLRRSNMWNFLDRFVQIVLPRIRDFKGLNDSAFDVHGNFSMGITDALIFPEVSIDVLGEVKGLDIAFVTSCRNKEESLDLLELLGFPFKGRQKLEGSV